MRLRRPLRRNYLLAVLYRLLFNRAFRNVLAGPKLRLLLDLTWVFGRLASIASYAHYVDDLHPGRLYTWRKLSGHLHDSFAVLDLGCSSGYYTSQIARKVRCVVGVDDNEIAIEEARQRHVCPNLRFVCNDAWRFLEGNDQQFDLLVLTHVLEHIDRPKEFLDRLKCQCRYMFIEVPDFDCDILNQFRRDIATPFIYNDPDHKWEFEREELLNVLTECGLKLLDVTYMHGVQTLFVECPAIARRP